LRVEDAAIVAGGLRLPIRRGKTDQPGQGAEIGLPRCTPDAVRRIRAHRVGVAGTALEGFDRLSAHAPRVGFITTAYDKGVHDVSAGRIILFRFGGHHTICSKLHAKPMFSRPYLPMRSTERLLSMAKSRRR
jgi:hypothetical protein